MCGPQPSSALAIWRPAARIDMGLQRSRGGHGGRDALLPDERGEPHPIRFSGADHFTAFNLPDFGDDFTLPISGATVYNDFGSDAYRTVGIGITTDLFDLPVIYDDEEEILPLPLSYGATLSGTQAFEVELPGILFYATEGETNIEVDGWGTLLLPGGSHGCFRSSAPSLRGHHRLGRCRIRLRSASGGHGVRMVRRRGRHAGPERPSPTRHPGQLAVQAGPSAVGEAAGLALTAFPSLLEAGDRSVDAPAGRWTAMDLTGRIWFDSLPKLTIRHPVQYCRLAVWNGGPRQSRKRATRPGGHP